MLILWIRYLLGYVNFRVKGEFPERLLNQLSLNGVSVWNMRRQGEVITASMKAKDYRNILRYRKHNRCFTAVLERKGLPFLLRRYRLRFGLALGFGAYIFLLLFLSKFVWNIEIVGNERIPTEQISSALYELGVAEGVAVASIDQRTLPSQLELKVDGISWASVNIEGVKVTVNVSESIETERYDNSPCNLIASRDGVITSLKVKSGVTAVKIGQTVSKGDLLVSGVTEYKDGSTQVGVSSGEIIAKTERVLSVTVPFSETKTVDSGEVTKRRVLSFFGLNVPLYLGSVRGDYRLEREVSRYEKNGMYLPIYITEASFFSQVSNTVYLTVSEAELKAEEQLRQLEETELSGAEIVSKKCRFEQTETGVMLTAEYICRENIAEKDLLLICAD